MNDPRGPRRFSKYQDGVSVKDFLLSITEEKFIGVNFRFLALKDSIAEARRLMEEKMAGFPNEYAKKLELEQTALMVKELKDKDLEEIKKLINLKLSTSDYDSKHEILLEKYDALKDKSRGWETIEANINGRLWTLGGVVVGAFIILGYLFNYGLHLPSSVGR
jgi:hypothetical protein